MDNQSNVVEKKDYSKLVSLPIRAPYYNKIVDLVEKLNQDNVVERLAGNCIGATDIFQKMLNNIGIESTIVEVELMITYLDSETPEFYFVGFDNLNFPGQVDTHLVIVTKTEIPLLIDLSISNYFPSRNQPIIQQVLNDQSEKILGEYIVRSSRGNLIEHVKLNYGYKKNIRLPHLHQKNLAARIMDEQKITKDFKLLRSLIIIAIAFGLVNFTFNSVLVILKMLFP